MVPRPGSITPFPMSEGMTPPIGPGERPPKAGAPDGRFDRLPRKKFAHICHPSSSRARAATTTITFGFFSANSHIGLPPIGAGHNIGCRPTAYVVTDGLPYCTQ